jgi:cytoskeletal protein RodZ
MKLSKTKNKKLPLIIIAVVVVLVAGAGYFWFQRATSNNSANPGKQTSDKPRDVNDVDYSAPTSDDKKEQDQQKEDIINKTNDNTPTTGDITVSISRAGQASPGQALAIRTVIAGTSSGTCDVTLSKEGQNTITKSFAIAAEATYSTCPDAQIAASDIPAGGTWKLQVVARNNASKSQPTTLNVTITK